MLYKTPISTVHRHNVAERLRLKLSEFGHRPKRQSRDWSAHRYRYHFKCLFSLLLGLNMLSISVKQEVNIALFQITSVPHADSKPNTDHPMKIMTNEHNWTVTNPDGPANCAVQSILVSNKNIPWGKSGQQILRCRQVGFSAPPVPDGRWHILIFLSI